MARLVIFVEHNGELGTDTAAQEAFERDLERQARTQNVIVLPAGAKIKPLLIEESPETEAAENWRQREERRGSLKVVRK